MANFSELTRKEQVLHFLQLHLNQWVDGPSLANEEVGGSEGLKRLRELRDDGHRIVIRPHPNKSRDIFQYKLVVAEQISPQMVAKIFDVPAELIGSPKTRMEIEGEVVREHQEGDVRVIDQIKLDRINIKAAGSDTPVTSGAQRPAASPSVTKGPTPLQWNEATGYWEATKQVCTDCEGVYEDEAEHRKGSQHRLWEEKKKQWEFEQQQIAIDPQPIQYKFTELPTKISMDNATLCPRCKGHRRAIKDPEQPKYLQPKRKSYIQAMVTEYEDFTRDPFHPTAKNGEPQRCPRCNGFGVVPNVGV